MKREQIENSLEYQASIERLKRNCSEDFEDGAQFGYQFAIDNPKWISVEDELPPMDTIVIGFSDLSEKFGEETLLIMTTPYDCDGFSSFTSKVTHWMPIPQPPK